MIMLLGFSLVVTDFNAFLQEKEEGIKEEAQGARERGEEEGEALAQQRVQSARPREHRRQETEGCYKVKIGTISLDRAKPFYII